MTLNRATFGQARLANQLPSVRLLSLGGIEVNENEGADAVNNLFHTISTLFANLQTVDLHFNPIPSRPYDIPIVRTKFPLCEPAKIICICLFHFRSTFQWLHLPNFLA